jgi:hypothetical protein
MQRAEPGVGFLVRRSRAPVLPVAVIGTERALLRGRLLPRRRGVHIVLRVGKVFTVDTSGDAGRDNQTVADAVGRGIAAYLPPAYRGVYADGVLPMTPPGSDGPAAQHSQEPPRQS